MIGDAIRKYEAAKAEKAAEAEAIAAAAEMALQNVGEATGDTGEQPSTRTARIEPEAASSHEPPHTPAPDMPPHLATEAAWLASRSSQSPPSVNMADVLALIKQLAVELRATPSDSGAQETATKQVELIEKLITKTHPENIDHPGFGVYSYPEGDLAHPKEPLKCRLLWCGYDLRTETMTPGEIALLNRLQPGEFRVTKADGTGIPFRVSAKLSDKLDGQGKPTYEELSVWFPCKGDARQNHMSMTSYLRQALGDKLPTL